MLPSGAVPKMLLQSMKKMNSPFNAIIVTSATRHVFFCVCVFEEKKEKRCKILMWLLIQYQ